MKWSFLQGSFTTGEMSPKAQGAADSEAYKAGLRYAENFMACRGGSIASRAGGKWLTRGLDNGGNIDPWPKQHVALHDSPAGDVAVEVCNETIRLLDGTFGVVPLNFFSTKDLIDYTPQNLSQFGFTPKHVASDAKTGTVRIYSDQAVPVSFCLSKGTPVSGHVIPNSNWMNIPAGTDETWTLVGKIAGSPVTLTVRNGFNGVKLGVINGVNDHAVLQPTADGPVDSIQVEFAPNQGGLPVDFCLQLDYPVVPIGTTPLATELWDLQLYKNGTLFSFDTTALVVPEARDGVFATTPAPNRITAASFWISKDKPLKGDSPAYWVAFAGGHDNAYAGLSLNWTNATPTQPGVWTCQLLPCTSTSLAIIQGANTVAAYQDRLCFGNNDAEGRSQIITSQIGYVSALDKNLITGVDADIGTRVVLFIFKVIEETHVVNLATDVFLPNSDSGYEICLLPFHVPAADPLEAAAFTGLQGINQVAFQNLPAAKLSVKFNGLPVKVSPFPALGIDGFAISAGVNAAHPAFPGFDPSVPTTNAQGLLECWAAWPLLSTFYSVTKKSPYMGIVAFTSSIGGGNGFKVNGNVVVFSTVSEADDPMNLTLASPAGKVSWLTVLRGLLMGTTIGEKLFEAGQEFAVDPANGNTFTLEEESSFGGDPTVPAITVNDKILFPARGRQLLRMAGFSISSNGGLIAEDVDVFGEHLTGRGIRSMCYLKAPAPRVVLTFDDGTAAVMSLVNGKPGWSRLTVDPVYGGIWDAEAVNSDIGSQLWLATVNGTTLVFNTLESDIKAQPTMFFNITNLNVTISGARDEYTPLPPCMDGWLKLPVLPEGLGDHLGTGPYITGLDLNLFDTSVFVFLQGQMVGPLSVISDPDTGFGEVDLGLAAVGFPVATTWTDPAGNLQPTVAYVGTLFPGHRWTSLPIEGGNPVGTSQAHTSRKPQLYLRFVDSYMPLVNGTRPPESVAQQDVPDVIAGRVTGDRIAIELSPARAAVVDVIQDKPLRVEVSAIFGGVITSST